jgi:hypothetical protein
MTWKCPHCGSSEGVDVMELLPSYHVAEITEDGKLDVEWEDCEVFWDGTGVYEVNCLDCREEIIGMEFVQ